MARREREESAVTETIGGYLPGISPGLVCGQGQVASLPAIQPGDIATDCPALTHYRRDLADRIEQSDAPEAR